jgi:hypothetical protein
MFAKKEIILTETVLKEPANTTPDNITPTPEQITEPAPIVPEIVPDDAPDTTAPPSAPETPGNAVIPAVEWNKLYEGHVNFQRRFTGVEASILDHQDRLIGKLESYDKQLEAMNAAADRELDRLAAFKKERFGD